MQDIIDVVAQGVLQDYKVLPVTTRILSIKDLERLSYMAEHAKDATTLAPSMGFGMVMERDTGFFVKLYDEPEYNKDFKLSENIQNLILLAYSAGYRMIEFDRDVE